MRGAPHEPDEPDEPPAEPVRRRGRKRRALALLALAFLVAAAVVRARIDGWVEGGLERAVRTRLGGELRVGRLEVTIPRLEVRIWDLDLRLPDDSPLPSRLLLESGRVRFAWSGLPALAAGRLRLRELEATRPRLSLSGPFQASPGERDRDRRGVFDLRVDHLALREGSVTYTDRTESLDIEARDLFLRGEWNPEEWAVVGLGRAALSLQRPPMVRPYGLSVESGFRIRRDEIDLLDLQASGDGLRLSMDADLRLVGDAGMTGEGRLHADLSRLEEWLGPELPPLAGEVSGPFELERGRGSVELRGRLQAERPRFGPFEARRLTASARYSGGELELTDLAGQAYGGEVEGEVRVRFEDETHFLTAFEGRGVRSQSLLRALELPLPLASRMDASFRLEGVPGKVATWKGGGSFRAEPEGDGPDAVPTGGDGILEIGDSRLTVRSEALEIGRALLAVEVDADLAASPVTGTVDLSGFTRDARRTQEAVEAILGALEVVLPENLRQELHGSGRLRASIGLGAEPRRLALGIDLAGGSWGRQRFDRAEVELGGTLASMELARIHLERAGEQIHGSAKLSLEPPAVNELELVARNLDAQWLMDTAGIDAELAGRVDAEIEISLAGGGRSGTGRLAISDGRWMGEPFDALTADIEIADDRVELLGAAVEGAWGEAAGEAVWHAADGRVDVEIRDARIRVESLRALEANDLDLQGRLGLQGAIRVSSEGVDGELRLVGEDWRVYGRTLGSLEGEAKLAAEGVRIRASGREESRWELEADVGWDASMPVEATVVLEDALFGLAREDRESFFVRLTGDLRIAGPLSDPGRLRLNGLLERAEIHRGVNSLRLSRQVRIDMSDDRLEIEPVRLVGASSDVTVRLGYAVGRNELEASATGHVDLGLLAAVFPDVRASGRVNVDIRASGSAEQPHLSGELEATEARVRLLGFPQALERISFRARLDGQRAWFRELKARFGNGEITAEGEAKLLGLALGEFEVRADAANVSVRYPTGFRGVYEGHVTVRGTSEAQTLGGRITMLRGLYDREFDLFRLLGVGVREYAGELDSPLPENVALDLDVVADGNVWVDNDLAELESAFDLHVGGSLRRPQVTGRLTVLEGGEIVFRDVEYRVLSGSLDFLDLERIDPYIRMRAETNVGDYTVFLRVQGTIDRFEYDLTSDPTLSTQDIIALLTTGRTLEEITAQGSGTRDLTGDVAGNYFAGALAAPFERQLQRLLGLEQVRINPLLVEGGAEPTTRITLGEEVADDLFVIVSTDVGKTERQIYEVQWRASPRFRLSANRDTLGGIGGKAWYIDRFWWKKRTPVARADVVVDEGESRPSERPPIVRVVVVGVSDPEREELLRRVGLRPGDEFSRSSMFLGVEAIKKYYVARDRIETRVDAEARTTEAGQEVVYDVSVAPPTRLRFDGPTKKEQKQLRAILRELWIESAFGEDLYDDSAARVREFYQERGYYAIDVQLNVVEEGEERFLDCVVDRGKAVRVREVLLEGAESVAEERIRAQMLTRPASLFSRRMLVPEILEEDVAAIRALYREAGFLRVKIASPRIRLASSADSAVVELSIEEGPRFTVSAVEFSSGLPFAAEQLARWSGVKRDETFSPSRVLEAESALRSAMDERGYPDARVASRVELVDAAAAIRFEIDPGGSKTVGEIRVAGAELTREKIVRRALKFRKGDGISRAKLLASQHALYQLGIFRNVKIVYGPLEGGDPSQQLVEVRVEEAPPFSSRVGAGYDTEAQAGLNVSLGHENVGGYDRTLRFQGKIDGLEKRLQLVGEEPRLFNHDLSMLGSLSWAEKEETGFTEERRTVATRVARRFGPRWGAFLRYSFERVDLSDVTISPDELQEERLVDGRFGSLAVAFVRDTRDDPLLPSRGRFFTAGAQLFAEPLLSEFTFLKSTVTGSGVWTFRNGISFATSVRLGLAWPYGSDDAVPISEAFFAGGDSTLRGFDRDEVGPASGGEGLLLFNQEVRVPIRGALKGVVFYDAGDVTERATDLEPGSMRHVLGAGLRFETPIGPLRLEYGRKLDREEGESSGELFLAIGSAF